MALTAVRRELDRQENATLMRDTVVSRNQIEVAMRLMCVPALLIGSVLWSSGPNATGALLQASHPQIDPCATPQRARVLLKARRQLGGIEYLPEALLCHHSATRGVGPSSQVPIADAFDALVTADPRYRWTTQDGVIVLRPSAAWEEGRHFLHQRYPSFILVDQNIGGALASLATILSHRTINGFENDLSGLATPQVRRRVSVNLEKGSILEDLNAIVRQHGAAVWEWARRSESRPNAARKVDHLRV